jgi:flagella basal body P-ring formation protein FlgA
MSENTKLVNFSWLDNKRFIVIFDAKGNDIKVRGSISKIVYLPVLNKTISLGQIIQKEDIEYTSFPEHKLANNVVQNEEALIGKTLRRRIMNAGDILNINDVVNPIVIKRGDLVTMRVENSSFIITARGKAQGSAAIGETVQVMNLESKRLIDGIVKDSQTVIIPVVSR